MCRIYCCLHEFATLHVIQKCAATSVFLVIQSQSNEVCALNFANGKDVGRDPLLRQCCNALLAMCLVRYWSWTAFDVDAGTLSLRTGLQH